MITDTVRDPLADHLGRVLLVIDAFSGPRVCLRGLDKLARLDFLLRYPTVLQLALDARSKPMPVELRAGRHERLASETLNIRWQYGPWDSRYMPLVGWLVGTRQIEATSTARGLELRTTDAGRRTASGLNTEQWERVAARAKLLRRHLNLTAEHLRDLVGPLLQDPAGGQADE